jgi:hypothetical protein
MRVRDRSQRRVTVVPAKAGTHFDFWRDSKMDSGFRRNDEVKGSRKISNTRDETN